MESILYSAIFLLTATNSFGQTSVSDTSIHIRQGTTIYYIDGIKVRGNRDLPRENQEEVSIITGGLPVNFGDLKSDIIQLNSTPVPLIPDKRISNKEQKMATE